MLSTKPNKIEGNDLIIEILLRLPSSSIRRFKPMCKQWHSIILRPDFRKEWRKRNLKPATGLIICSRYASFVPFSPNKQRTDPLPLPHYIKTKGSCNGLLLCEDSYGYHHVRNPITGFSSLPLPKLAGMRSMSLAYDPNKSLDYTIVSSTSTSNHLFQIHIYSSSTRRWALSVDDVLTDVGTGVYCNGSIHWKWGWLYFNIENQTLKPMPEIAISSNWTTDSYLGESCGRMNYVKVTTFFIDFYELKMDYSQWVLKYRLDCECYNGSLLSLVHGVDDDDETFLVLNNGCEIVRHNLVSKTSEVLQVLPRDMYSCDAYEYFESCSF